MTDHKPKTNEGTNKETVFNPKPAGTVEKVNPTTGDTHPEGTDAAEPASR